MTEIQRKKRSLTEQGAWILGARAIGFSFNILLPLLLIRRLDQTQFGLYKQAFLIIITASQVLAFGFGMSAYYFLPRETDRKPQIIFNILLYNLFVGTLACLALVLAPEILGAIFHSDEMTRHAPLIGVAVLFWIFSTFLENAAVANQESHLATFFIIGSQITKTALLLGAAVFFGTVDSLIIAFLIQTGLQAVVMLFYLNSRFPGFWFAFNPRTFWQQAVYAVPLGAAGLLWAMQTDLHNYFVSHKFTPAEFAIYAVGCFELPLIGMLSEAVTSVLIPRMSELESKNDKTEILNLTIKAMERLAFAYFPIYVLFMIVAESFIATLFTENYLASVPIFRVNITLLPFYVVALDAVVRAFKQLGRVLLVFRIFLFVVLVTALWFGINHFSLIGMIGIVVAVTLFEKFVMAYFIGRTIGIKLEDAKRLNRVGKIAVASIAAGLPTMAIYWLTRDFPPIINLFLSCVVFAPVYLGVIYLLGTITEEEKQEIQGMLRKFNRFAKPKNEVIEPLPLEMNPKSEA